MASKRKSTIPCMIPVKTLLLQDELEQGRHSPLCKESSFFHKEEPNAKGFQTLDESPGHEAGDAHKDGGTYTCRPCNFETQDLNLFLDHVYSGHPEFRTDPTFLCVDCGVSAAKFEGLALHNARVHPSTMTTTLQLKKKDRKVTVEQNLIVGLGESTSSKESEISITKTPIMKMLKGKSESKRIVVSHPGADEPAATTVKQVETKESPAVTVTHVPTIVHNGAASKVTLPSAIQIVNGSGALPLLKTANTQVVSVVQNRSLSQQSTLSSSTSSSSSSSSASSSKNLPKVMIPLSSIPTYNASMDNSSFLKTSFSKFPYPTKAELCYLTVVTKYPEEQIKIWFTAQRLKQGISWSPEEIEDARRKMFNTIIQTAPPAGQQQCQTHHSTPQQTIAVLPASLGTTGIPHILQGSLVGQGGVIVTQPMMANGIQVSSAPVALAVTPKPQAAAKPMMQAKPAAALVADKGLSMVVGSVGSSNSGNYTISNSSSGGSSSSSSSSSSSITSSIISSLSTNSSHASVISIGSSSSGKINSNSNSKASIPSTNGKSSASSSSNAKMVTDNKNSTNVKANTAKSSVDSKGSTDVKGNTKNNERENKSSCSSSSSNSSSPSVTASSSPAMTATADSTPSKSESPSPVSANSRTLPTSSFLDPSFYKAKKSQEQLLALKESFLISQFPSQEEVDRLTNLTGLTVREVRKWFSDRRYHFRNLKGSRSSTGGQTSAASSASSTASASTAVGDVSDNAASTERPKTPQKMPLSPSRQQQTTPPTPTRRPPRPPSPDFTAIRYKEREPHQVRALEASFAQDPDPSGEEVDRLRAETKMTRREIHGWFADRRRRVAAEKKKEELERAEREDEDDEDVEKEKEEGGEVSEKGKKDLEKEVADIKEDIEESSSETGQQVKDEKQKEDASGTAPKVNPIKINLKMLKVTESNGKGEMEGSPQPETTKVPPVASQTSTPSSQPPQTAYRGKKTPEQLHLLKQAFARTHWPSSPLYNELIAKTGLPRPEVVRWFGDCRYVLKNGQLKWLESYQSMVDEEDFQKGNITLLQEHLNTNGKLVESQLEELAKSSGLSEELVRRWFTRQTKAALPSEEAKSEDAEAMEMKPSPSAAKGKTNLKSVQQDEGDVKDEQMEQSVTNLTLKDQTTKKTTTGETDTGAKQESE
ncbi:zinc fingers and homeoboxes protein 3 [Pygocentrus nattereri]|uniref:Homeobox domain-containing protein n=1 Tax=Pygocentrus nattereri TaxID=42514 RepID=A0AAR2IMW1_PYGNA|nr:zinc fingers and homeoboxes protein 3 [Pygocentrus nattereri]